MRSQPRSPVVLPAYELELAADQRAALRRALVLAAPLLVAFTLLDKATAPQAWLPLLAVRLVAAVVLGLLARAARGPLPPELIA
jgi:hypothetical protein